MILIHEMNFPAKARCRPETVKRQASRSRPGTSGAGQPLPTLPGERDAGPPEKIGTETTQEEANHEGSASLNDPVGMLRD